MNNGQRPLRSGEYKQGTGILCDEGNYCCLGVLGELAGGEPNPNSSGGMWFEEYTPSDCFIPPEISKMVWLDRHLVKKLVHMNDRERKSFSEIADFIDSLPQGPPKL